MCVAMIALDVPRIVGAGLLAIAVFTQAHIVRKVRGLRSDFEAEDGRRADVLGFAV